MFDGDTTTMLMVGSIVMPFLMTRYISYLSSNKTSEEKNAEIEKIRIRRNPKIKADSPEPYITARFAMDGAQYVDHIFYALLLMYGDLGLFGSGFATRYMYTTAVLLSAIMMTAAMRLIHDDDAVHAAAYEESLEMAGHQSVAQILQADDPNFVAPKSVREYLHLGEFVSLLILYTFHAWWKGALPYFLERWRIFRQWIHIGKCIKNKSRRWIAAAFIGLLLDVLSVPIFVVSAAVTMFSLMNSRDIDAHQDRDAYIFTGVLAVAVAIATWLDKLAKSEYLPLLKGYCGVDEQAMQVMVVKFYDVVYHPSAGVSTGRAKAGKSGEEAYWKTCTVTREAMLKDLNAEPPKDSRYDSLKKWRFLARSGRGFGLAEAVLSCKIDMQFEPAIPVKEPVKK